MDLNSVSSLSNTSSSSSQSREIKHSLEKDDFLLLYIEQLRNQDPMEPMDTNQMATQMSQFASMEQLTNINTSLSKILESQMADAVGYIGFQVDYTASSYDSEGNQVSEQKTGIVASVVKKSGVVNLKMLDGSEVPVDSVISVRLPSSQG